MTTKQKASVGVMPNVPAVLEDLLQSHAQHRRGSETGDGVDAGAGVGAAHVSLGPALGKRGGRFERSQVGATRAARSAIDSSAIQTFSCSSGQPRSPIALPMRRSEPRSPRRPVCRVSTTSAAASTIAEIQLLAGVGLHHVEPGIERRLSFGADADLIPTRSSHEPLSADLFAGLSRNRKFESVVGLGPSDAQAAIVGREAAAGLEVEAPAVQRAHQLAVVDLAEHAEIGLAVRAQPLDDVVADADLLAGQVAPDRIELARASASARRIRSTDSDLKKL